uniref:Uncharacterized protein n=1 Tax=Heliothis virescens TaxID=7102 RepID=A0A2A4J2E8_HELVI
MVTAHSFSVRGNECTRSYLIIFFCVLNLKNNGVQSTFKMPKRSYEERIDYYMKKMEKLRDKYCRKRRREDSCSYSDDDNPQDETAAAWNVSQPPTETEPYPSIGPEGTVEISDPEGPRLEILPEAVSTQLDHPRGSS